MNDFEIVHDGDDRAAWLAHRRSGIGSSDAPAVLGVSPFTSALKVYTEKTGASYIEDDETEAMKWGRILEPHILEEFSAETGRRAWREGALIRSKLWPWMTATLDGSQEDPGHHGVGVLEIKATGWRVGDWDEGVPHHVFVQVQHQLAVTNRDWASVAVLQNGCRLLWADVKRNDGFILNVLLDAERDFWERVQSGEPVAPDGSESAASALRALYPEPQAGELVHLPAELLELDEELQVLDAAGKESERRREQIRQLIKAAIGGAEIGQLPNGVQYTHRKQSRAGFAVKPAEFRVLRRVAAKGR